MSYIRLCVFVFLFTSLPLFADSEGSRIALVIHGGAGNRINREELPAGKEKEVRKALEQALQTGYGILKEGGNSLDAVETVIRFMENSPLFNAGKGSVFNSDEKIEMDASIMDGRTMMAGAVAAASTIKNPISAARRVMENSPHVMLIGDGAEEFAAEVGLEIVDPSYFYTEHRYQQLLREKAKTNQKPGAEEKDRKEHGTVGAVALDARGNLAAGTSTGGRVNKRYGRVGDSPIIGAGTYAKNNVCGISGTGHGEFFIRTVAAYNICSLMEHKGFDAKKAAEEVLMQIRDLGGDGGVIVMDGHGNHAMVFNTSGMYRGSINAEGRVDVQIYKQEEETTHAH